MPSSSTAGDTNQQAAKTAEPAFNNPVVATLAECWGPPYSPDLSKVAARLAEIAAAKLHNRVTEVLDDRFYEDCDAEQLVLEIFGCVSDELTSEDVKEWALEILEPWCQQRDRNCQ
jgi:hypothetical protein